MKLQNLKAPDECETCQAPTTIEHVTGQHCNGERFEGREYGCGKRVEWVPNFSQMVTRKECPHSDGKSGVRAKRRELVSQLLDIIKEADCDEEFKDTLRSPIKAWSYMGEDPKPYNEWWKR